MISARRAFPKAVTLSMDAHIAIFGSALAFAQYAGDALRFSGAVITVALVSDGEGGAAVRRLGADTVRRMPADPDPMPPAVTGQEAEPVRSGDDRTEGTAAPADGSNGAGTFSAGKGEGTNAAADSGADNGMGGFSSEQWRLLSQIPTLST